MRICLSCLRCRYVAGSLAVISGRFAGLGSRLRVPDNLAQDFVQRFVKRPSTATAPAVMPSARSLPASPKPAAYGRSRRVDYD